MAIATICLLLVLLLIAVAYIKWKQTYWQRRGVVCQPPDFLIGNLKPFLTKKMAMSELLLEQYWYLKNHNVPAGGMYFFNKPICLVVDRTLIKQILIQEFKSFNAHGIYHHKNEPLSMNLFAIDGDYWKYIRTKMTPAFSSGKGKMMFEAMLNKSEILESIISKHAKTNNPIAVQDLVTRFTIDIIGTCGFGIECNSMQEQNNTFEKCAERVVKNSNFQWFMVSVMPWNLLGNLGFSYFGKESGKFFGNLVKATIKYREENKTSRKDFIQLMIEMKHKPDEKNGYTITDEEIIAQCFVFFLGGFETTATTLTFALFSLAQHQDIQDKLREEINTQLSIADGKLTYDTVMGLPYLDQVVNETLRMYPPLCFLPRTCNKTFKVPNSNIVIENGMQVFMPIIGLQRDPEFYPNPEIFDPERFNTKNKSTRPDFTYLPFGEGPRMCTGIRVGMLQTKLGLSMMIRRFKFTLNDKTILPIRMSPEKSFLSVKGELWLNATEI